MTGTELVTIDAQAISLPHFQFDKMGIEIIGNPSFEEWEQCGTVLGRVEKAVHWWIGDWLNWGEQTWGEMYAQAMDETGFDYSTIRNDKWVSSQIELSRRRDNLSWSHHQEIAALEPGEQDRLLEQAEANGWTRQELRREVRALQAGRELDIPLPSGKYRVLYADPPWEYDNSGFDQSAAAHYPTMSVEAICALPVDDLCTEESVLFLWATSPLLPEALQVLAAWGFTYKTCLIWSKDRAPGIGWYLKTNHELLLLGVRAETPHPTEKPYSVQSAEVGKHSEKPVLFYSLIESMYPGPYLELFARSNRQGWKGWGNEFAE